MSDPYLWLKAVHIMAFAAWMAGMWYLPRLLVYHRGTGAGSEASQTFKVMERRLLKAIATPAMVLTILLGLVLTTMAGLWTAGWLHAKLSLALVLAAVHGLLAADVRRFAQDERPRSAFAYRVINEVPTVLFVLIVLLAVFRPF